MNTQCTQLKSMRRRNTWWERILFSLCALATPHLSLAVPNSLAGTGECSAECLTIGQGQFDACAECLVDSGFEYPWVVEVDAEGGARIVHLDLDYTFDAAGVGDAGALQQVARVANFLVDAYGDEVDGDIVGLSAALAAYSYRFDAAQCWADYQDDVVFCYTLLLDPVLCKSDPSPCTLAFEYCLEAARIRLIFCLYAVIGNQFESPPNVSPFLPGGAAGPLPPTNDK
jgi:hypothetical protein